MSKFLFCFLILLGLVIPTKSDELLVYYKDDDLRIQKYIDESDDISIRDNDDCYYYTAEFILDLSKSDVEEIDYVECIKSDNSSKKIRNRSLVRAWEDFN